MPSKPVVQLRRPQSLEAFINGEAEPSGRGLEEASGSANALTSSPEQEAAKRSLREPKESQDPREKSAGSSAHVSAATTEQGNVVGESGLGALGESTLVQTTDGAGIDATAMAEVESPLPKRSRKGEARTSSGEATNDLGPRPPRWRKTVSFAADGSPKKRMTIVLPEEMAYKLAYRCDADGLSVSDCIERLVRRHLARD